MFKNLEDLKIWILDYIQNKGKSSLHVAIKNSKRIKDDIIKYSNYLPLDAKYNQRCYHIINDLYYIPICKNCKTKNVNFNKQKWSYFTYCSNKCVVNSEEVKNKFKKTMVEKYGVDNISKSQHFIDIMISKNQEKYGVDWYQQSDDFKIKSIKTCLEKYGFTSYTKTNEFKIKLRETFIKKYGVDWYSKSIEFRQKFEKTCLEKYGVSHFMKNNEIKNKIFNSISNKYGEEYYFQSDDFKIKSFNKKIELYDDINYKNLELTKKTNFDKYGVDHPMKNEEVKNKMTNTCLLKYNVKSYLLTDDAKNKSLLSKYNNSNWFKHKDYKLPSGKIVKIQGYENYALDILLKTYDEDDILISDISIKNEIGIINYIIEEKDRIYLPDIYIKSENKIIEVKSKYTYETDKERNDLKKSSCLLIGMNFEFWIISDVGDLLEIK